MPEPTLVPVADGVRFAPPAPLHLRFEFPDGTPVPDDYPLRGTPAFHRFRPRVFRTAQEALACA